MVRYRYAWFSLKRILNIKVLEELLYSKDPGLSSDQNKALYLDFCIRNKGLQRKSVEFKHTLKSDPYFNALRLKFGYAITCHKAQGSEWSHVFVKCKSHQSQLTADYFRWFYTAITRTAKNLYLLDPPNLKLGGTTKLVPTQGIGLDTRPVIDTSVIEEAGVPMTSSVGATDALEAYGIPASAPFLLAVLNKVRKLVDGKGVVIDSIIHNQNQEAYLFNRGGKFARVDIVYNSKGKVTRVTAPQLAELSAELADILSPLQGLPLAADLEPIREFRFEKPFLNDYHQKVLMLCAEGGIAVRNVAEQQWTQRYTFIRDGEVAVYDIWYNAKSQFTKCQPLITACSPGALVGDVGVLLTVGMAA